METPEFIATSLETLSADSVPAEDVLAALETLSRETHNNPKAKAMVGTAGLLGHAVGAMARLQGDPSVLAAGCKFIRLSCFQVGENAQRAVGSGAVQLVAAAMARHIDNVPLVSQAVWAMLVLSK